MSTQTRSAREWLAANPKVTAVNVNAYEAMVEHAETVELKVAREIVAWLRAYNGGSLRIALMVELLADWVQQSYVDKR